MKQLTALIGIFFISPIIFADEYDDLLEEEMSNTYTVSSKLKYVSNKEINPDEMTYDEIMKLDLQYINRYKKAQFKKNANLAQP